jgi:hypothetical protein
MVAAGRQHTHCVVQDRLDAAGHASTYQSLCGSSTHAGCSMRTSAPHLLLLASYR